MVMKPEPWAQALAAVPGPAEAAAGTPRKPVLIVPSPGGGALHPGHSPTSSPKRSSWSSPAAATRASTSGSWNGPPSTSPCGPMSLGDYVLNGGEVAVLAMVEAVGRLLPGVVGNPESLVEESHSDGLLEYPVYTKPSSWRDREVPAVLLSGNHGKIAQWRRHEQYRRTAERRPDLLDAFDAGKLPRADRTAFAELGLRRRRRPAAAPRRTPEPSRSSRRPSPGRFAKTAPECGKISPCACWVRTCHRGSVTNSAAPRPRQFLTEPERQNFRRRISGAHLRPGLAAVTQRE